MFVSVIHPSHGRTDIDAHSVTCLWVSESFTHFPIGTVIFVFVYFISMIQSEYEFFAVYVRACVHECVCVCTSEPHM